MPHHTTFVEVELGSGPAAFARLYRFLADAGITVEAVTFQDGRARILTQTPTWVHQMLQETGHQTALIDVLDVQLTDGPRGLAIIMDALDNAGINVAGCHGGGVEAAGRLFLHVDNPDKAAAIIDGVVSTQMIAP